MQNLIQAREPGLHILPADGLGCAHHHAMQTEAVRVRPEPRRITDALPEFDEGGGGAIVHQKLLKRDAMAAYEIALNAADQPFGPAWRLGRDDRRHLQVISE